MIAEISMDESDKESETVILQPITAQNEREAPMVTSPLPARAIIECFWAGEIDVRQLMRFAQRRYNME